MLGIVAVIAASAFAETIVVGTAKVALNVGWYAAKGVWNGSIWTLKAGYDAVTGSVTGSVTRNDENQNPNSNFIEVNYVT